MNSVHYNAVWEQHNVTPLINIDSLYSFFLFNYGAEYSFAGETHDFWEGLYVISGKIRVTADERVFTLSSGEIVFHKPLELHKLSVESKEGVKLIIFTYSASGELANAMANKALTLNPLGRGIIENMHRHMLHVCKNTKAEIADTNTIAAHRLFSERPDFVQMTATYIAQLIIALSGEESQYKAEISESALLFSKAVDYMNENVDKSISLSD
ncbi:MAG: AraC family ligand binding domain-containing protein, partial [Clostridia bacterium]|nr:AraC family ligand binding domain-containing protein [Clostridia bacterium]